MGRYPSVDATLRNPTTGIGCCCARAASGHATAAPPSAPSNSRRPRVTVIRPSRARCVKVTISRHERAVFTFKEEGCWLLPPLSSASTALLPPPALRERRHRGLARRRVAMSWRPIFTLPEGQCPHPRRTDRRRAYLRDTTDDDAIGEHVEIIFVPLAEGPAGRCAFKDEVVLFHPWGS